VTYICMLVGTLALTGFPSPLAISKDPIIEAAYAGHNPFPLCVRDDRRRPRC